MRRIQNGIFIGVEISQPDITLSDIVSFLNWGSNREIKQNGYRVGKASDFMGSGNMADLCQFASETFATNRKNISLIKDPRQSLMAGHIVFTPNGSAAAVLSESPESSKTIIEVLKQLELES